MYRDRRPCNDCSNSARDGAPGGACERQHPGGSGNLVVWNSISNLDYQVWATTNLQIMAYQYSFQWYQMGKGMAQAIVLLILVVMVSYLLMRLWNRASESTQ